MEFKVTTAEESAIRGTVQSYIDGFLGSDTELLRRAFDGGANLIAASEGKVESTATTAWFERIDQRRANGERLPEATSQISGIDQNGNAAVARVDLDFPEYGFTDYLSLLKTADGWKVVNKVYTVRG